jgi:hypothetical protein
LAFTNRVVAEFLAARWIVRHGYPNWPYASDDPSAQYTKPTAASELTAQVRDRGIMDFLGDHAWTIDRHALVQAVCFELGRTRDGSSRLIRVVQWICRQIEVFYADRVTAFDIRRTLVARVFEMLQALQDDHTAEHLTEIVECAHRLIPPIDKWWEDDIAVKAVRCLPPCCKAAYSERLATALDAESKNPGQDWFQIANLYDTVASGFTGDINLTERARDTFLSVLDAAIKQPTECLTPIGDLACVFASGFAADATLKERAHSALSAAVDAAIKDPKNNLDEIGDLAGTIASRFAADAELKKRARDALSAALDAVNKEPSENWNEINSLARVVFSHFAFDARLNKQACDAMSASLDAVSEVWEHFCVLIRYAFVPPWRFTANSTLKRRVRDALSAALYAASKDPKEHWKQICDLTKEITAGFAGDPAGLRRSLPQSAAGLLPHDGRVTGVSAGIQHGRRAAYPCC